MTLQNEYNSKAALGLLPTSFVVFESDIVHNFIAFKFVLTILFLNYFFSKYISLTLLLTTSADYLPVKIGPTVPEIIRIK